MKEKASVKQPTHLEKLSDSCLAFRLDQQFISDNTYLFIAPDSVFCRTCFQRRYVTQMVQKVKNDNLHRSVLELALKLDNNTKDESWQAYSVAEQKLVMSFELSPYEDCPACSTSEQYNETEIKNAYQVLMENNDSPDIEALKKQVLSFGFGKKGSTTQKTGLPQPVFDKIFGNNFEAKIIFKMIAPDGRYVDDSAIGFDQNKELAELKSLMEYLERYAFMIQLCRFKTSHYDDNIIMKTLTLYSKTASQSELEHIRSNACWGINLATNEIRAIPLPFIFNYGQIRFLMPSSSGFAAHIDFQKSMCRSILELVERDAYVRFWHDPLHAFDYQPDDNLKSDIDDIISILQPVVNNENLISNFYVMQSPTKLPVALVTISSKNFSKPPSLCFGCGAGFSLNEAIAGAIEELRQNIVNLVKGATIIDGFLTRKFTSEVKSIPDRMNLYATSAPRKKLKFLDNDNPLIDGIVEDAKQHNLKTLVQRFDNINFDIYGIDCTPRCFSDKNVFVTKAFSPQLYPLQFEKEGLLDIPTGALSSCKELPHFFI